MVDVDTFPFKHSFAELQGGFYADAQPTPVPAPRLIQLNHPLARELGLNPEVLTSTEGIEVLAGNRLPKSAKPLAMAYSGHQFGHWVSALGDGRAIVLGELVDRKGVRRDFQLKGAGLTPFSRMGDGRAALGPVIREYLASEAMAGLGIPSQRALAMVDSGQAVYREQVESGALLTRITTSLVRFGTFEYFYHRGHHHSVRKLADYVIARHEPDLVGAVQPYQEWLNRVAQRTADMIANWLLVGFIHGVMNTDNMSIVGETIDYGPFGFLDTYQPAWTFSSIDHDRRYAFNQQPRIGQWNLARFAETLLPLLGETQDSAMTAAHEALDTYAERFETAYNAGLRRKLGLIEAQKKDSDLASDLLTRMAQQQADYTLVFRRLADLPTAHTGTDGPVRALFADPSAFDVWVRRWRERLAAEGRDDTIRSAAMRAVNPAFVLRNHWAQYAIDAVPHEQDFTPLDDLLTVLAAPYEEHPGLEAYAQPPTPEEVVPRVGCGT